MALLVLTWIVSRWCSLAGSNTQNVVTSCNLRASKVTFFPMGLEDTWTRFLLPVCHCPPVCLSPRGPTVPCQVLLVPCCWPRQPLVNWPGVTPGLTTPQHETPGTSGLAAVAAAQGQQQRWLQVSAHVAAVAGGRQPLPFWTLTWVGPCTWCQLPNPNRHASAGTVPPVCCSMLAQPRGHWLMASRHLRQTRTVVSSQVFLHFVLNAKSTQRLTLPVAPGLDSRVGRVPNT